LIEPQKHTKLPTLALPRTNLTKPTTHTDHNKSAYSLAMSTPDWLEDVVVMDVGRDNNHNNSSINNNPNNMAPNAASPTWSWMNINSPTNAAAVHDNDNSNNAAAGKAPATTTFFGRSSGGGGTHKAATSSSTATTTTSTGRLAPLETSRSDEPTDDSPSSSPDSSATTKKTKKTWSEYLSETMRRDGRFVLITIAICIAMNVPYLRWLLYPFTIFSTWIHEICHGLAAEMIGADILKLQIFPDGSGLAYIAYPADTQARLGFVVSAGYQGTSVIGCLLLLVRRTKRGPRTGCLAIAILMLVSVLLWIRENAFGLAFGIFMGSALVGVAVFLPSQHMRNVYVLLAVTCSLNAITSVHNLFGNSYMVNGEASSTDAHTMAGLKNGTTVFLWATIWLFLSIFLTIVGILFALPGADEVADFTICGICQDIGCFTPCNAPGRRICSGLFGRTNGTAAAATTTTTTSNAV
jgi:hypothetical protein